MRKLERFYEQIKDYKRLSIGEAKKLLIKARECSIEEERKEYLDKVILGTLYVVYNHIKNNSFELLENSKYDMDDIINSFVEQWINIIKSYKLLKYSHFSFVFGSHFYTDAFKNLSTYDYLIFLETETYSIVFSKIFGEYLKLRNNQLSVSFEEYLEILKKYEIKDISDYFLYRLYTMLESIYNNMNFNKLNDCELSERRAYLFRDILMDMALEEKLDNNLSYEFEHDFIEKLYGEELINATANLNKRERKILDLYYYGGMTCAEIGRKYKLTGEGIRTIKAKALKKVQTRYRINLLKEKIHYQNL